MSEQDFLIVALDTSEQAQFDRLVNELSPHVSFFKVGMQLFYSLGFSALETLGKAGKKVFLDLKINDIPNTVLHAVKSFSRLPFIEYMTVFTGEAGVKAARAASEGTNIKILNVTVLTSEQALDEQQMAQRVQERAELTQQAGGHGIICSGRETAMVRQQLG